MYSVLFQKSAAALALSAALFQAVPAAGQSAPAQQPITKRAVPGELIVKFKRSASDAEIEQGFRHGRLRLKRHLQRKALKDARDTGLTLTTTDLSIEEAAQRLSASSAIEYVEPNLKYHHFATSDDPYIAAGYLWGLYGDLSSPENSFGSQAAEAWNAGHVGTNAVYVGVIDEGIDVTHPDLAANIWTNPHDPVDGVDNDGNGYIDDVHGWDFAGNRNQVFDAAGDTHGTHVAGTVGARGGNGIGIAGVNWNVTIIPGKFLGSDGGTTLDAVEAIDYYVDLKKRHNLNIVAINASWGGAGYSQALHDAVIRAAKAGILFVAAAGNEALNNDISGSYPANYDTRSGTSTESAASYDAIVSVAAISNTGALASFSNFGAKQVDLGAPGVRIFSTYPGAYLGYMDGTSMAAPHVTGAAALYASTHPGASASAIRAAILGSVIPTPSLKGKTSTGGRLDLSQIVTPLAAPAAPEGLIASAEHAKISGTTTINIRWNASPNTTSYTVKRGTSAAGPWTTLATGVTSTSYAHSVAANNGVYFYVVSANNGGGESANSAVGAASAPAATPVRLIASATAANQVKLTWSDRSADEQGFKVEYWNGWNWVQLGIAAANSSSVNITGTASRTTYRFQVRAYNGSANTPYSNMASVTTP